MVRQKVSIDKEMNTIIKKIEEQNLNIEDLQEAAKIIKNGGLVAFPTETVYGLGANAMDAAASKKIYQAKGRPSDNPLIVHIHDKKQLEDLAVSIPDTAFLLADVFWPGPLTMILNKKILCHMKRQED